MGSGTHNYPQSARDNGHEGRVMLSYVVDTEGQAKEIQVTRSSGHRQLDRAAIQAIRRVQFKPGIIDGEPVNVRTNTPVLFRLQ